MREIFKLEEKKKFFFGRSGRKKMSVTPVCERQETNSKGQKDLHERKRISNFYFKNLEIFTNKVTIWGSGVEKRESLTGRFPVKEAVLDDSEVSFALPTDPHV